MVLVGTDNGYIFRRGGPNNYSVVYEVPSPASHAILVNPIWQISVIYTDKRNIFSAWDSVFAIYSTNGGKTWVERGQINNLPGGIYDLIGIKGLLWPLDEEGHVWSETGPTPNDVYKSPDFKVPSFDLVGDAAVILSCEEGSVAPSVVADGYVWCQNQDSNVVNPFDPIQQTLSRCDYDGSDPQDFAVPWPLDVVPIDRAEHYTSMSTWPVIARIATWPRSSTVPNYIISTDVTNPAVPAFTFTAISETYIAYVLPITNQIMLAVACSGTTGTIYRSTDGGTSWVAVLGPTTKLGRGSFQAGELIARDALASNIWVASSVPYIYHSTDLGLTWEEETVDVSSLAIPPRDWESIAAGESAGSTGFATLIGAT